MASRNKQNWTYVGDKGVTFAIHVAEDLTAQAAKIGGADLTDKTHYAMPTNLTPRKVEVENATEGVRYVPVYSTSGTLWTTPGTTIDLPVYGSATAVTFTATGRKIEEKQRGNNPLT